MRNQIVLNILSILFCIGCSPKNKTNQNLSIEIKQTLQNKDVYPIIEIADSILAEQLKPKDKSAEKAGVNKEDTTLTLLERLAEMDKANGSNSVENFKEQHPLFYFLSPNITVNENNQGSLKESSIFGHSFFHDTTRVNKYLTSNNIKSLFPKFVKFIWSNSTFQDNVFGLSAIVDSLNSLYLDTSDIESIIIGNVELFKGSWIFESIRTFILNKEYSIVIKLNNNAINGINRYFDSQNKHLIEITLNGIKYGTSYSIPEISKGIKLGKRFTPGAIDSIKTNFSDYIKEI